MNSAEGKERHNPDVTRREFLLLLPGLPTFFIAEGSASQFEGQATLDRILNLASKEGWRKLSLGELVGRVGLALVNTKYEGWTLERDPDREFCYVNLDALDCVTFYESALGMARMIKAGERKPDALVSHITRMRYRNGQIAGYPSRLHYTTDWMTDNDRRGLVEKVTHTLEGSVPMTKTMNFMSQNPNAYRQLKAHPELIREIEAREEELNRIAKTLHYLPKGKVQTVEGKLKTGDIVGIVTSVAGLDCSHTGLIIRKGEEARFLHASSTAGRVVSGPRISDYLSRNSKSTGILVARPI